MEWDNKVDLRPVKHNCIRRMFMSLELQIYKNVSIDEVSLLLLTKGMLKS